MNMEERYLKALEHFNAEEFIEAHDVLEGLWGEVENPLKKFYQGIIQIAISLHHLRNGNLAGARNEYLLGASKLKDYAPSYEGMDVEQFIKDLYVLFNPLFNLEGKKVPEEIIKNVAYPKISLKTIC